MMDDFGQPARTPAQQEFQRKQQEEMAGSRQFAQSEEGKKVMADRMREMEAKENGFNKFAGAISDKLARPAIDALKDQTKDIPVLRQLTGLIDNSKGDKFQTALSGGLQDVGTALKGEAMKEIEKEKKKALDQFLQPIQKTIGEFKGEVEKIPQQVIGGVRKEIATQIGKLRKA